MIVTGASAGVGRALVRELAKHQMNIGLIARGQERLEETRSEVEAAGSQALALCVDVADDKAMFDAADKFYAKFGSIDFWINNAMVTVFGPVDKIQPDEFKRVTDVTYLGTVYGSLAALKFMKEKDQGTILQVGSALAYRSIPLQSAYCAAKHAILGFTDSLRCELLHDNSKVQVCMAQLPAVNTPQFSWMRLKLKKYPQPVPPIFQPEYIANEILELLVHPRREKLIGFSTIKAVWGQRLAPRIAERYLARKGFQSQFSDLKLSGHRMDNLYSSSPLDFAAHGLFDDKAKSNN